MAKKDEFDDIMGDAPQEASGEDRLHPILTNADVREAQANARKKVDDDRRKAAMKDVEKRESVRLRMEEGLTSGIDYLDEMVDVTMDLPPWAPFISVNGSSPGQGGRVYHHNRTYSVPRHIANSLNETMYNMRRQVDRDDGKDLAQSYARKYNTTISERTGAVQNAPRHFNA